ncbi:glutamine--tRNA ligase/YqeY domain fusion protein [Haploplasma axanthum]|uniref:Glutamine--tRNA ligase n=1 Tax=Haploplasma axanthum TaxID=29552 RepID=A0A449BB64_HAPAX|nr:glutamine--tRNA ligase/YqeY domain fusion protein [Haploplasma axanthum]VEU79593.1 Glutamine--tRNA ligase [Haploplasma axanthum]
MENQSNFIKTIMEQDLESGKHKKIVTRFPPEPNGFLHIGHARAIIQNFELAKHFGGYTNLRYDDTNPAKEEDKYVKSIREDIEWLGYTPANVYFASDYFEEMYNRAIILIKKGLAYVDNSTPEQIAEDRGSLGVAGKLSPYRNRSIEENLELFEKMRNGEFKEGECVLRAKIDMASPNMNMRDPILYRISYAHHHNTKDKWCIYPMYDYAHPLEDAIEGITHSLCSLEFEDHRPLYDWVVKETEMPLVPRQIEFGRLGIENTVMSKRYLLQLVQSKTVTGWDDPRMPTLSGLRRRGYTKDAIKNFILSTGLSKINSTVSSDMLEAALRDDLQNKAKRVMGVIDPLKVTITNYPENEVEHIGVPYNSDNEELGSRDVIFSREIYIDREDFVLEKPNKKYKRLALGIEVRLFHAYFIKANEARFDKDGNIIEILATYDPETKSGSGFDARKPNGTIQFVSSKNLLKTKFNYFEPMILDTDSNLDLLERFNKDSWEIKEGFVEKSIINCSINDKFQLLRHGFFNVDKETTKDLLVLNEIVSLKKSY